MIIELFGLPGSGKTALADALKRRGAILVALPSRTRLVFDAGIFWLARPLLALMLLWHIAVRAPHTVRYELFVNGYLGYAARYRRARALSQAGATVVLDQGFFQLCISLINLPPALLQCFPRPDFLVAVTADTVLREERMATRGWAPRGELGTEGRLAWQKRAENAFHTVLSSLELVLHTYPYDGARDPEEGATALLAFATRKAQATVRVSPLRNLFKITLAIIAFLLSKVARIFDQAPQVVILMYHAVDASSWKLAVSPKAFEREMKYLAERGWAVPLASVVSYAKGEKELPAHAVAVTFDDGYQDLLVTVLPTLERHRIPVTVFVPSDLSARTDQEGRARLTREELRTLAQSPLITIGSHAVTHRKFTELSREEMQDEAKGSMKELAHISGGRPCFFAYPFGARSGEAEDVIRDVGYEAACSITEGTIRKGDNLFRLKRVQVDGTMSFSLFRLRLTSAVDWNRRVVDAFRAMMPV